MQEKPNGLAWFYNISIYIELVVLFFFKQCSEIKSWGNCISYLKFLVIKVFSQDYYIQNPFNSGLKKKLGSVAQKDSRLVIVELIADWIK